jgi:hypothetical protein
MRAPMLVLSLALGVPACMDDKSVDVPPPDWIAVPPGVADRLFLDRVRATLAYAATEEWAGSSI